MSISRIMNQGQTSMAANQMSLATTSHNVANVNTKGYSRQTVQMVTNTPQNMGNLQVGGGAKVGSIHRVTSEFVNRRLEQENSNLGRVESTADVFSQLEQVFKNDGEAGITKAVSTFFNDVRNLSVQPESVALRTTVKESARGLTTQFKNAVTSIDSITEDINNRISANVAEVNSLTTRIGDLNNRIVQIEIGGTSMANDERDQRDMAVQALSKIMEVKAIPTENGSLNIMAENAGPLVNGSESFKLITSHERPSSMGGPGVIRVKMEGTAGGGAARDVTDTFENGGMAGLVKVRDQMIPRILGRIDQVAHTLSSEVNRVHAEGFGLDGKNGHQFFAESGVVDGAARSMSISDSLDKNVDAIAASRTSRASGDNGGLLKIAAIQDSKVFDDGRSTITDFSAATVGGLGAEIKASNEVLASQSDVVSQLSNFREQVSGVSLDEEALNMVKFQKAFDASAKVIQVADQMLDTVLNLKRF